MAGMECHIACKRFSFSIIHKFTFGESSLTGTMSHARFLCYILCMKNGQKKSRMWKLTVQIS